ncbi:ATP-binding protein [Streptomyces sp. NPDC058864]
MPAAGRTLSSRRRPLPARPRNPRARAPASRSARATSRRGGSPATRPSSTAPGRTSNGNWQLARRRLDHPAEATELIVSEPVTNAVIHGGGDCDRDRTVGLRLVRHAVLNCEVFDPGHGRPLPHSPTASDEHRRGLFLVSRLSRAWGSRHLPDGKLMCVDRELTPSPGP